jgi:hypothetical protein
MTGDRQQGENLANRMKTKLTNSSRLSWWKAVGLFSLGALFCWRAAAVGYWTALANTAPDSVFLMLQLSDGTVMAARNPSDITGGIGHDWYRLTPDSTGNYANGTWTTRTAMNFPRLFYSSEVLTDGRVFVAGGEYGNGARASAEIYDPVSDAWGMINPPSSLLDPSVNNEGFVDSESKVLPNGNVLVAPIVASTANGTLIYNPFANSWSAGPASRFWQAEVSWVKLPDNSILSVDPDSTTSERYIPSLNTWVNDGTVPVSLWATLPGYVGETGPAFLLPDGRAFFIGGSGHTAYYTPSGNTSPGTWTQGPDIPGGLVAADAPGAMMVNGKILVAVAPAPYVSGGNPQFPTPTSFYEFDYTAGANGTFTLTTSPTGGTTDGIASYQSTMLALADGTILYCHIEQGNLFYSGFGSQLYVYHPDGSPVAAGKPTISSLTWNNDATLHLVGTQLNGISEGAAYGDDAQMNGNYPLVRLIDGAGNVSYARTFNWSSTGVRTGSTPVSTEVSLPGLLYGGFYSLQVVANGIGSDPIFFVAPVWVDFNYSGFPFQLGTFAFPYNTLGQGVTAVQSGGTIAFKPGHSAETGTISKPMTLMAFGGGATIGQ